VVQRAAAVYERAGDTTGELELRRKAVAISDLVFSKIDVQRGTIRMDTALALARHREFDEAERLADEAVAIGQSARTSPIDFLKRQQALVRQMRSAQKSDTAADPR
jgi:hypothetical protein